MTFTWTLHKQFAFGIGYINEVVLGRLFAAIIFWLGPWTLTIDLNP